MNFNDIPLRETKIIHLPENVVEVIRLNPVLPCNISFKDRTLLKKIENVYFDSSIEYGYWYYGGGESPMHVRFTGEILNPTASKESYVKGFAVMDEASKTDFLEHLKA